MAIEDNEWMNLRLQEITIQSGAAENVCPRDWGGWFPITPAKKVFEYESANGESMEHISSRWAQSHDEWRETVTFRGPDGQILSVTSQMTDVINPMAVDKLAEHVNLVQLGPNPENNFIRSLDGQLRVPVIKKGCLVICQV